MITFFLIMIIVGCLGYLHYSREYRRVRRIAHLQKYSQSYKSKVISSTQQAVDLKALVGHSFFDKVVNRWEILLNLLGKYPLLKLLTFLIVVLYASKMFNDYFIQTELYYVTPIFLMVSSFFSYNWLDNRKLKVFEETFPVALNMLASAVSAGESITQAVAYVGESLDGRVGEEFRIMGKRLQLGESPEDVFKKSCVRLPYPNFYFFVITLRANMERGGQLKDIIQRLNGLMFNIRATEKKKYAMTAEARISAKIVGVIPLIFLVILRFTSPENYNYIMTDDSGRLLLYYMIASELIGMSIIWGLMKSVR